MPLTLRALRYLPDLDPPQVAVCSMGDRAVKFFAMDGKERGSVQPAVNRTAQIPVDVAVDPNDARAVVVAYKSDKRDDSGTEVSPEVWSECVPRANSTGCTAKRRATGSFGASPMVASSAALNFTLLKTELKIGLKTEYQVRKCVHSATDLIADSCGYQLKMELILSSTNGASTYEWETTIIMKAGNTRHEFNRPPYSGVQVFDFCLPCGTCVEASDPDGDFQLKWWIIDESSEGWDDPLFEGTGQDVDDFCTPDCLPNACVGATTDDGCFGVCEDFIACPSSRESWEPSALLVDDEKELVLVSDSVNDELHVFDLEGNELYTIDVEATTSLALKPGVFAPLSDVSLATTR
jgi:hypothetical protein